MTPTFLLPLLGLLLSWEGGFCLVPPNKLQQMSETGSKYIDNEVENAINGVKQMKTLLDESNKDHQQMLNTLEDTKKKKEEALFLAKETEMQLTAKQEVCNETMLALWEECKPCLKQTCMRFYSRTCHSGAGLVGRQLEEVLNHSSPFSFWVNGERVDSLMDETEEQGRRLHDLEERYTVMAEGVDHIFQDSQQASGHFSSSFLSPFSIFADNIWNPFRSLRGPVPGSRVVRNVHPFFPSHPFRSYDFTQLFQPFFEAFENDQWLGGSHGSWLGGFPTEARNFSSDRMVCREIRRNSSGCLRMKEKCEKCQAILDVDCSQTDPNQSQLRERFEDALRRAEQFSRMYDNLFKTFQEEMFNTTRLLDQLNYQFGWVSRLANLTWNNNRPLQVTAVLSTSSSPVDSSQPSDTEVTVQLFDLEPQRLTVPGNITWQNPKFIEIVAEKALRSFRNNDVI
ncbi:clusterin [Eublepharis macularius]|uniref:Clusterin n=1 Tax=Eublepharis macularius TaxID=481883 RepID=A0AA97KIL9_EUBMA|nr:clusterin [Eublepharis macularius]XP_054856536.1 clusterin [Eublepharis macularius]